MELDRVLWALDNVQDNLAHSQQLNDGLADALERVAKVGIEMTYGTLCLTFASQDFSCSLFRRIALHDALGIDASDCRQQFQIGADDCRDVIKLYAVVNAGRSIVFDLVVCTPAVVQKNRIVVLVEVAVAFDIAFDGFCFSDKCVLRSLRHTFAKLREAVVDQLLYGTALTDDALPDYLVVDPHTFAVDREHWDSVDFKSNWFVNEILVQHAIDFALVVVHSVVGDDGHGVHGLVVCRVDNGTDTLFWSPFVAVLGPDPLF